MLFSEAFLKKNQFFRIEVALRDEFGTIYNTIYINSNTDLEFLESYETNINLCHSEVTIGEGFFIRIPTKQIETLRKLYAIFLVQVLINKKD